MDATITSQTALLTSRLLLGSVQLADLRQVAQVLQVPEQEGPMGRQRQGADQERQHGGAPHGAAKQLPEARRGARRTSAWPRAIPRAPAPRGESTAPAVPAARRPGTPCASGMSASRKLARLASMTPRLTPVCSTAAIHGRQRRGQVSDSSDAPTAHSPPMPSAARKRKIKQLPPGLREIRQAGEQRRR